MSNMLLFLTAVFQLGVTKYVMAVCYFALAVISLKPAFHGACFGAVSAPTLSARVPRRARAAFEKERFHYEHSSCFHGADCRAD